MFLADLGLLWFVGLALVGSIVGNMSLAAVILYAITLGLVILLILAGEHMARLRHAYPVSTCRG
jgi:uncharacterized membrane protein YuzA (DUF378 family)